MNTWRDIKTAPKNQPVLVTVEGMVCFGRFCDFEDEDYSGIAFDGACLSDGESVSYFADYIGGWQPAPDTWKPEKSADEMFRELGYLWEGTPENGREYECVDYNDVVTVTTSDVDFHGTDGGYRFVVPAKLVLACAQLIREMEVNNG